MFSSAISLVIFKFISFIFVMGIALDFMLRAREMAVWHQLRQSGSTVEAKLIDRTIKYGRNMTAHIVYHFVDAQNRAYERIAPIHIWKYRDWTTRTTVQIRFLPNEPYISRMADEYPVNLLFAAVTIVSLFGADYFFGLVAVLILVAVWLIFFYINVRLLARPVAATPQ